jgi:hypothetical protein
MSPSRNTAEANSGGRRSPFAWVVAGILLLAAVVASFWVPIYARSTPKLGAFPFFYWYQLILVPAVAIMSWLAYLLVRPARTQAVAQPAHTDLPAAGPAGSAGPAEAADGAAAGPEVTP